MTLPLSNSCDGASAGTTVTAGSGGNSGGSAGNFFDTVTIGASEADTFDATNPAHGTGLGLKITSAATVAANFVQWDTSLGTLSTNQTLSGRFYYVPPTSSVTTTIRLLHILNGTTVLCGVAHTNTVNNIQCRVSGDAAGGVTTGTALTSGTLYRVEYIFTGIGTAATGTMNLNVFLGDSLTSFGNYPISATTLNFGTLAPDRIRYGICTAAGVASLSYLFDGLEVDSTGVGPGPEPFGGAAPFVQPYIPLMAPQGGIL